MTRREKTDGRSEASLEREGSAVPARLDAPFYTEEELDALYRLDPLRALKISREQALLRRKLEAQSADDPDADPPSVEALKAALEEARRILLRDGGDLEFVALEGRILRIRMKGNCAGCPRSALDLKNVVERLVRNRFPQIAAVQNVF